jgi:hypothetical protein
MHTPEQAKELWCPMARVGQVGEVDVPVAYNRTMSRFLKPVKVAIVQSPSNFEMGEMPKPETGTIMAMEIDVNISTGSECVAEKCAMWRWVPKYESASMPTHTSASAHTVIAPKQTTPTYGYCGLAGTPGAAP